MFHHCNSDMYKDIVAYMEGLMEAYNSNSDCYGIYSEHIALIRKTFPKKDDGSTWFD